MRLITSDKQGEWFVHSKDEKTGERMEYQIRRIPAGKAKEIEIRHLGKKRHSTWKKGVRVIEHDVDQGEAVVKEKAAYALIDSKGCELPAEDVPSLSGVTPKDGYVTLDGHWSDAVKAEVFEAVPALALWIVEQSGKLETSALEDEAGKERS
jgi:hypothetical protein